ncbi:MAG: hypothetical protein WCB11_05385 [Terriglobales bacterium]|jgi:serine phosphatase RsbU (regulator of sigma subunit)
MPEVIAAVESELVNEDPAQASCLRNDYLREAQLIQASLLPVKGICLESVEIAFRCIPFSGVGGDFADFFELPDGFVRRERNFARWK